MRESNNFPVDIGLDVVDIHECDEFWKRGTRPRRSLTESQAVLRLCNVFLQNPDEILQELADIALELCGADSVAVSFAQPEQPDEALWLWVAAAGEYKHLKGSTLPLHRGACGRCVACRTPQHLRARKTFFEALGVDAKRVTDGILLPWITEERQGAIWVLAHDRLEAFDQTDLAVMKNLIDFAVLAWRQRDQENKPEGEPASEDAVAMSKKLGEMILEQRRAIAALLQSTAEKRVDAERTSYGKGQPHLKESHSLFEEWDGDGTVH